MPDILHRLTIDAPTDRVHDLISTTDGIARWWTGRPLEGSAEPGGSFSLFFGGANEPAAVMRVVADTPDQVTWRVEQGPESWIDTVITFALRPHASDGEGGGDGSGDGSGDDGEGGGDGTTLLFTHADWQEASEFMSGCSTNWGSYLTSLKTGAESGRFAAYPHGEISRWS
jgi:uncharacterized protein YndB with AHSA1/START domain